MRLPRRYAPRNDGVNRGQGALKRELITLRIQRRGTCVLMVRLSGQGALKRGFSPSFKKKSPLLGEGLCPKSQHFQGVLGQLAFLPQKSARRSALIRVHKWIVLVRRYYGRVPCIALH